MIDFHPINVDMRTSPVPTSHHHFPLPLSFKNTYYLLSSWGGNQSKGIQRKPVTFSRNSNPHFSGCFVPPLRPGRGRSGALRPPPAAGAADGARGRTARGASADGIISSAGPFRPHASSAALDEGGGRSAPLRPRSGRSTRWLAGWPPQKVVDRFFWRQKNYK